MCYIFGIRLVCYIFGIRLVCYIFGIRLVCYIFGIRLVCYFRRVNCTAVLDFLWACLHKPVLWQGCVGREAIENSNISLVSRIHTTHVNVHSPMKKYRKCTFSMVVGDNNIGGNVSYNGSTQIN